MIHVLLIVHADPHIRAQIAARIASAADFVLQAATRADVQAGANVITIKRVVVRGRRRDMGPVSDRP
jgi:hypothetical protein